MRAGEKQKIIITVLVLLAVVCGLSALNYMKYKERAKLVEQIARYKEEERVANEKIQRIPELRKQRTELVNIIDQYAEILPKEEHVQHDTFVEIIDGYRKDTKIMIQKAEYVEIQEDENAPMQENFIRHRYRFKLLGTVPDFIEFVNRIENHTRFLKVDSIRIKPLGTQDEMGEELGDKADDEELTAALEPVKEIELTVSTYTYFKGQDKKV